ncbi:hypothetical protein VaNZ11_015768, partial [Volvox africanus]
PPRPPPWWMVNPFPPKWPTRPPSAPPQVSLIVPEIVLEGHNAVRMLAGVGNLTWDENLAQAAQQWSNQCTWQHASGNFGQNLASGSYRKVTDPLYGIYLWYIEVCNYDFSNPGYSEATGHYTQMVWADTTAVGCGYTWCGANGVVGLRRNTGILVCHYSPPGNVNYLAAFMRNVLPPSAYPVACPDGFTRRRRQR